MAVSSTWAGIATAWKTLIEGMTLTGYPSPPVRVYGQLWINPTNKGKLPAVFLSLEGLTESDLGGTTGFAYIGYPVRCTILAAKLPGHVIDEDDPPIRWREQIQAGIRRGRLTGRADVHGVTFEYEPLMSEADYTDKYMYLAGRFVARFATKVPLS